MAGELSGHVAIVTGGGGGFGRAIAQRFAGAGAAVAVTSRTKAQLDETVGEIQANGGRALAVAGDARNREDVARVVAETEKALGPVTILVNNAGVPGPFGPIGVMDPDEWWEAQAVHLRAPFLFASAVLAGMKERRAGCLITICSPRAKMATPYLSAYCIGKTSQIRLTELLAAEGKDYGIRAFAVDPGSTPTQLADKTIESPDAQRWVPEMVAKLRAMRGQPGGEVQLESCARRCVEIAAGRHDEWNGTYIGRENTADPWR